MKNKSNVNTPYYSGNIQMVSDSDVGNNMNNLLLSEMIKLSSPFWLLNDFEITLWIVVFWESYIREASQEITSLF